MLLEIHMNKIILGAVIALAIISLGSFLLVQSNSSSTVTAANPPISVTTASTTATSSTPVVSAKTYTQADVATHANAVSCWAAINGKVYDLTKWINQHPGGPDKILGICGKDGSAAFNDQHGSKRRPASELAGFYIANLTK